MLLNKTTNINNRNKHGNTALHVLFYHGFSINKFTIIYLDAILKKGADVTLKNTEGNTPLDLAIMDVEGGRQLNEEDTIIWNKIKEVLTPKYGAIPVMYEEDTENEGL
jgi:ankyrin repeat protein